MRASARLMLMSFAVSAGVSLAACDTIEWVTDSIQNMADTKRRLPGDRKPVFPEGVPGASQGVPQEYLPQKAGEEANEAAAKGGDAAAKAAAQKKDKPVRKPQRPQTAEAPKKPAPAEPAQPQAAEPQSPAQAPSSQLPWPAAPAPGTFSR